MRWKAWGLRVRIPRERAGPSVQNCPRAFALKPRFLPIPKLTLSVLASHRLASLSKPSSSSTAAATAPLTIHQPRQRAPPRRARETGSLREPAARPLLAANLRGLSRTHNLLAPTRRRPLIRLGPRYSHFRRRISLLALARSSSPGASYHWTAIPRLPTLLASLVGLSASTRS
jgi:hypothetical protein